MKNNKFSDKPTEIDTTTENDKTVSTPGPKISITDKPGSPKTYAWKTESGVDVTVEFIGSYTVMSNAFAEAHPEIAAHAAAENAKMDAIFAAARAEPEEA